jgi:hypothetical protein
VACVLLSQTELELQKCIRYLEPIHQYPRLCLYKLSGKPIVISSLWCLSFIKFFYPAFCLTTYFDSFDVVLVNFGKLTFNTTPWGKRFSKTSRVIFRINGFIVSKSAFHSKSKREKPIAGIPSILPQLQHSSFPE